MNRIYRRIWNAARQCWVVASELSSPRGKPAQTRLLMSALLLTTAGGAFAANETDDLELASESSAGALRAQKGLIPLFSFAAPNSVASAIAPRGFYNQLAIVTSGNYADAQVSGADVLALGSRAKIYGTESTGLGNYAETSGGYATAVGHFARAFGGHGTALGTKAYASGKGATALGHDAQATSGNALAIGSGARASYSESIAIGANSVAYESGTVSMGNSVQRRRITNINAGESGYDAVNVNQLNNTNRNVATVEGIAYSARNIADTAQTAANNAKSYADSALAKANIREGLLYQTSSSGTVRLGGSNSGTLLDVRTSAGGLRRVYGVANATLSNSSNDAVNGSQLFATNQDVVVAKNHAAVANTNADAALIKIQALNGLISQTNSSSPLRLGASNSGLLLDITSQNGSDRIITGVGKGDMTATSSQAVNGSQLYATDQAAQAALTAANFAVAESTRSSYMLASGTQVTEGNRAKASDIGSLAFGYEALAEGRGALAVGRSARSKAQGAIAFGDGARVLSNTSSDSIAFGTNASTSAEKNLIALGRQAAAGGGDGAVALGAGASARGENSVALGAGSSASGERQLSVGNSTIKRKIVNVAQGDVSARSEEAVTGAQLFATDQAVRGAETAASDAIGKASDALAKATTLAGLVSEVSPTGDVRLGAGNSGSIVDVRNSTGSKRRLSGLADGALIAGGADAVNGGQLFATDERAKAAHDVASDVASRVAEVEAQAKYTRVGGGGPAVSAQAGLVGVALGDGAEASLLSEGGVALGSFAKASGKNSVALGRAADVDVDAERGFALGVFSLVEEYEGVALGAGSVVRKGAMEAVAVGAGSIAEESNTVSFGSTAINRRLVNVARGTAEHNATTVGQLNDSLAALGGGAKLDTNGGVIAPTYAVQNTRQRTVGDALTVLDNAVVRNASRVDGMEGQLRSIFQDTANARADGFNQLTLAGAQGMVISNVANGLIAAGSREAVNGGQLHAVQQQLNGRIDGLEQRVDGQGPAPQSRAMALASTEQDAAAPTPPATQDDKVVADTGNAPKSSPAPQPKADAPESPKPQVDTAELEKMLARANDYSDGIAREVDARLNKMDKRFNRMAAMSSAQTAMAMNTAGLATYNRLGAGVGYAEGESAMAVGYQRVLNDKGSATFSLNGAFTNSGESSMGVGVGIGW
ncbi:TPA: ESPR-type extended signal peptide-containing protein [Stenotrophomonas maltophilia]